MQSELATLEQAAILRIANRQPSDAEENARRGEIITEIGGFNRVLEEITERCRRLRAPLEQERQKLLVQSASWQTVQAKLTRPPLVNPALAIEAHILECRKSAAGGRISTATRALRIVGANIASIHEGRMSRADLPPQQARHDRWSAELQAASQEQADAMEAGEALMARMLEE